MSKIYQVLGGKLSKRIQNIGATLVNANKKKPHGPNFHQRFVAESQKKNIYILIFEVAGYWWWRVSYLRRWVDANDSQVRIDDLKDFALCLVKLSEDHLLWLLPDSQTLNSDPCCLQFDSLAEVISPRSSQHWPTGEDLCCIDTTNVYI